MYAPLSHVVSPVGVGHYDDFESDPFNDFSHPVSPIDDLVSPVSSTSGYAPADEAHNEFGPVKNSSVECCRCSNIQPLLSSWSTQKIQNNAVCDKCTSAFCSKCVFSSSATVLSFNAKSKASIPQDEFNIQYLWFCSTCGGMENIPLQNIKRMNGVASTDMKGLSCLPCRQKANSHCLKIAFLKGNSLLSQGKELPRISEQPRSIMEEEMEGLQTSRPTASSRYSDGYFSLRHSMTWRSQRSKTVSRMKRWTSFSSLPPSYKAPS